jgi:hypothetical protein
VIFVARAEAFLYSGGMQEASGYTPPNMAMAPKVELPVPPLKPLEPPVFGPELPPVVTPPPVEETPLPADGITAAPAENPVPVPAAPQEEASIPIPDKENKPLTPAEEIDQAFTNATRLLVKAYDTNADTVADQMKLPKDHKDVVEEIKRREQVIASHPELAQAINVIQECEKTKAEINKLIAVAKAKAKPEENVDQDTLIKIFMDETGQQFKKVDDAGNPTDELIDFAPVTKVIVEQTTSLSGTTDSKIPEHTQQAQELTKTFGKFTLKENGAFETPGWRKPRTKEEVNTELNDRVAEIGVDFVKDQLDIIGVTVFKTDEQGHINGVDMDKVKQMKADPRVGRMVLLMGAYYDKDTPILAKDNLSALIYREIERTDPKKLKALGQDNQVLLQKYSHFVHRLRSEYLAPEGYTGEPPEHLLTDLFLGYQCEGNVTVDATHQKYILSKGANDFVNKMPDLTPRDKQFIIALSVNGLGTKILAHEFGFNLDALSGSNRKAGETYVNNVVDKIGTKPDVSKEQKKAYDAILKHQVSDEVLAEIAANAGMDKDKMMVIATLLMYAFQIIQSVTEEGLATGQQGGQGPH